MTLVDPIGEDAATKLLEIVEKAGYTYPRPGYEQEGNLRSFETISKGKAKAALEAVVIQQLDSDGAVVEQWTLHNPFINKVGFGDLSYEDDNLSEISLGLTYDWATYSRDGIVEDVFQREVPR